MQTESVVTAPEACNRHERRALEAGHLPSRLAYSIDRFCEDTDTGRSKVYELIRTGRLRAKKFGSKTLILAEDADRFLASLPDMTAAEAA
jgi:excisionase family DNA binding protein